MKLIEHIYEHLEGNNIYLHHVPFPNKVKGHCKIHSDFSMIFINNSVDPESTEYRIILAEEIGHYHTTMVDITPHKLSGIKSNNYEKYEYKARSWAADFLIDTSELLDLLKHKKVFSRDDIINHFDVTQELLNIKLENMKRIISYWDLGNDKFLVLTNLPSIYIYNQINNDYE